MFTAIKHNTAWGELGSWFVARWNGTKAFFGGIATLYTKTAGAMSNGWGLNIILSYVITTVLFIGILTGLFFLLRFVWGKIKWRFEFIGKQYDYNLAFVLIISADIFLVLLYACLFFTEQIRAIIPFENIFSDWLFMSIVGCFVWHLPLVVKGVIEGKNYPYYL